MNTKELAERFGGRREGEGYRARCPVHKSKGQTLGIYPKEDRSIFVCYAGCRSDDILAAKGLNWRDALYVDTKLTPEQKREWAQKKLVDALYAREVRMQGLKLWLTSLECKSKPVRTQSSFERDIERFCNSLEAR